MVFRHVLLGALLVFSGTSASGGTLFDSTTGIDTPSYSVVSGAFTDPSLGGFRAAGADDFTVPASGWRIDGVRVVGRYGDPFSVGQAGPAASVNVYVLPKSGTLPSSTDLASIAVWSGQNLSYTDLDSGDFSIPLPNVDLPAGDYWLVVQANIELLVVGQWEWSESSLTPNSGTTVGAESAWFQSAAGYASPVTGTATCVAAWGTRVTSCQFTRNPDSNPPADRDFAFALSGLIPQTITFDLPPTVVVDGTGVVSATGGASGIAVEFSSLTPGTCTVSGTNGSTVTGVAVGNCMVAANQAGDVTYAAAAQQTQTIVIGQGTQATLTAAASPPSIAFGETSVLSVTGGSGAGAVSYAVTSGNTFCDVSGNTLAGIAVGNCTVTATKAADANYSAAVTDTVDVTISRAAQATLTAMASPLSIPFGGTSDLSTNGGSGAGAVSYSVTAGGTFCEVNGSTLTGTAVGSCTVAATKAADANYNAATATVNVSVGLANQAALTATATPPSIPFNGTSALTTMGGSGSGAVTYAVTAGNSFCAVTGTTLTGTGVGTCTVTATKAADANYSAATATVNISVGLANQAALTATATPASILVNSTSSLGSTGGSGTGAVTFAVTAGDSFCSVSGATLTGTAMGNCTLTATKAADANYNAATATVAVAVIGPPTAPTNVRASFSGSFAQVSWNPPTSDGGLPITSYRVEFQPGGAFCEVTGNPPPNTCTVTGLQPAVTYTITVRASNGAATGGAGTATGSTLAPGPAVIPVDQPWALILLAGLIALLARRGIGARAA